jgi:hypothetical protein
MTGRQVKGYHLILMNHHDPVMAAHLAGGDGGTVATAGTAAGGVPGFNGDTVTSPADIEAFTTTTTFQIMQSYRLDRGHSGPVHP